MVSARCAEELRNPTYDLLLFFHHVDIGGGGQVGVTEDRLDITHRQRLIAAHAQRGRMP